MAGDTELRGYAGKTKERERKREKEWEGKEKKTKKRKKREVALGRRRHAWNAWRERVFLWVDERRKGRGGISFFQGSTRWKSGARRNEPPPHPRALERKGRSRKERRWVMPLEKGGGSNGSRHCGKNSVEFYLILYEQKFKKKIPSRLSDKRLVKLAMIIDLCVIRFHIWSFICQIHGERDQ